MESRVVNDLHALRRVFDAYPRVAVAVSGGVDSMTLGHLVHAEFGARADFFHAVSPAVPTAATERVKRHAGRSGWRLTCLDAGEFSDPRYRSNPLDRCYYCKSNLYDRIAAHSDAVIFSGANTDDLADFRPGLRAASERGVRHPFIEAGFDKAAIRAIAKGLGLDDLSELPAAPCLSSRVETRIAIEPADLRLIDLVEETIRAALGAVDVRCRLTASGARLEFAAAALDRFLCAEFAELRYRTEEMLRGAGKNYLGAGPYRKGSAFLREAVDV
jgi:pyridinium-3,5-biscarboxylic acid mononucleotide sulfurtransferase